MPWLPAKICFEGGFTPVLFDSVSLNGHPCLMALLAVNGIQIYTETRIGVKARCDRLLHVALKVKAERYIRTTLSRVFLSYLQYFPYYRLYQTYFAHL
jgi:hypothetical protein